MAVEEQLQGQFVAYFAGGSNWYRVGQLLTISNRIVSKLSFKTYRVGNPNATITFTIRKDSNDAIIVSKVFGAASSVGLSPEWIEVTFDTPTLINEDVRILMEWSGTNGDLSNYLACYATTTSVKAGEQASRYYIKYYNLTQDATYIYTYTLPNTAPTVTTQAVTTIGSNSAAGNGNITDLGDPATVTAHGVCWNTGGTPTTADSKSDEGAAAATGAYTTPIVELSPKTKYYVRAYATNATGTGYGGEVTFTTNKLVTAYGFKVIGNRVHYIDTDKAERYFAGTLIPDTDGIPYAVKIIGTRFHYFSSDREEYYIEGTLIPDTDGIPYAIKIVGTMFHYFDSSREERYIEGILIP